MTTVSMLSFEDRVRPYATIYNFRDFGGYAAGAGKAVRTGSLYRSAHLANLSDADMADIDGLGIDMVVDMRHAPERRRQPSRWSAERVLTLPHNADRDGAKVAPHEAFTQHELKAPEDARRYMMGSYASRPHDPGFKAVHRDVLLAMTEPSDKDAGDSVLVHCAAGKDRTGTMCALILGLLGVSDDDIMADYLLTREAVDIEVMLEPAAAAFSQRYGREFSPDSIRPMFGVDPDYLTASLDAMGSFERYATDDLGIDDARLERLRRRYQITF